MSESKTPRKALVTGASRGLGRAIAEKLVERGIQVWGTSRTPNSVKWPKGIQPVKLDQSTPDLVEQSWNEGGLDTIDFDIVINNAGSGFYGEFAANQFVDWDEQINVLLRGPTKLARLALDKMVERGSGVLVNVSSGAVLFPIPFMSAYNASKAALSSFSQTLMTELEPFGIKVIDFQPFDMDTGFNSQSKRGRFFELNEDSSHRAWDQMDKNCKSEGSPELVAYKLVKAVLKNRSGVVRAGGFFQSVLAPFFARFSPLSMQRALNKSYYKL